MKKVLLSAVALLAFGFANAQEEKSANGGFSKGDVFVSGVVGFGSEKTGDQKDNSFTIAPKVGFFVTENIAVGGKLGYTSSKTDNGVSDAKNNEFAVGAFGRYYFTPANQFSLFAELGVDYMSYDNEYGFAAGKGNGFGATLGAGLNYFVSSNFSIEAGVAALGFNSTKPDASGADATNTFSFGGDWTAVTFGVNYKF